MSSELVAYCCDRETFTTFFGSVQALIDKEVERRERQLVDEQRLGEPIPHHHRGVCPRNEGTRREGERR